MNKRKFSLDIGKQNKNIFLGGRFTKTLLQNRRGSKVMKKSNQSIKKILAPKKLKKKTKQYKGKSNLKKSNSLQNQLTNKYFSNKNYQSDNQKNNLKMKIKKIVNLFGKDIFDMLNYQQIKFCLSQIGFINNLNGFLECSEKNEEQKVLLIFNYLKNQQNQVKVQKLLKFTILIKNLFSKKFNILNSKTQNLQIQNIDSIFKHNKILFNQSSISFENLKANFKTPKLPNCKQQVNQFNPKYTYNGNFLQRNSSQKKLQQPKDTLIQDQSSLVSNSKIPIKNLTLSQQEKNIKQEKDKPSLKRQFSQSKNPKFFEILKQRGFLSNFNQISF